MLRPYKLLSLLALAILSSLLAGLITYRHLSANEKPRVGDRRQDATVMPLLPIHSNTAEAHEQDRLRIEAGYANLPLSFEPNQGQTDPRVRFVSRAGTRTLWLTADEAVLAVGRRSRPDRPDPNKAAVVRETEIAPAVLRMKFVGANTSPAIEGEAKQSGTVNYFAGKPDEWRTKIPTYARVRYRSLYPGIDLVFYGNNRELEYDLVVAPGADAGQIKLQIAGAEEIRIDDAGNLVLKTSQGEVMQQKPKIYQRKGTTLTAVAGNYVITGKDEVGFRLGKYDSNAAVVIDPVLRYSTFLGGDSFDDGRGIAVDSSNRAVVGGKACSLNFPRTVGPTSFQGCAAFITKFDFTGSRLIFSSFIGESAFDVFDVAAMALDSQGNSYVTGIVEFMGFPTTPGAFQPTLHGDFDAFVAKLSPDGSHLVYSTFLGGFAREEGDAITADSQGNAYITGNTTSEDFPTTGGVFQPSCKFSAEGGCSTTFITKLSPDGSHLVWSTFLGGAEPAGSGSGGQGIAVDRLGNVFVTGSTSSSDFPTTAGTAQSVFPGDKSGPVRAVAFVSELSSSGSHLVYSTFLGGGVDDGGRAIAVDSSGNAFVTGATRSTDFPVKNAFQPHCATSTACFNAFVSKLDPDGRLVYSTYLGGPLGPSLLAGRGTGIAVTADGKASVIGLTSSTSFPTTQTAFQRLLRGDINAFLTKFDSAGRLIYSSYLGGNSTMPGGIIGTGPAVALDRDANAYVTGTTSSSFPTTPGAFQTTFRGGESDAFVAKIVSFCALSTVNRTVTICSPGNGSTVTSPVRIIAGTTDVIPVKLTQVYLDGKKIYETPLSAINVGLPIAGGTHRLTVQGLDTAGVFFKKSISINVSPH
jgi:Beta-propeller repeat/Bacterial Ig domain